MNKKFLILNLIIGLIIITSNLSAITYHVRPDGSDNNTGLRNIPEEAWKSIDRGQPTRLLEATKEGQTEIKVSRAVQFPRQGTVIIGKVKVKYSGRTHYTLTGCTDVPSARPGTIVRCDLVLPQAGDTVIVHSGCYYVRSDWPQVKGLNKTAVSITSGGTTGNPVIYKGEGMPVLDGRHLAYALRINNAHNVVFDGFDIRRNCVFIWQSSGIKILNCRIHEGRKSLSVRYSKDVEIAGNKIYHFYGAWTHPPLSLGAGEKYHIHHNTITMSGREGIGIFDKTGSDFRIEENIITRCRLGIKAAEEVDLKPENVKRNCLWNLGKVIWLGRVAQKKEGIDYYKGLTFTPEDLHEDPGIISFYPESPYFLDITKTSPCVTKEGVIGAGKVLDSYPVNEKLRNKNLVINPGFENGWNGWSGSAWQPFKPGQAGWGIVSTPGQTGTKCLEIFHFPDKGEIQPRVRSNFVTIDRGYPVTLSFRAKSKNADHKPVHFNAALLVPSWHYGSNSARGVFNITNRWQNYQVSLKPEDYYPNRVAAAFMVRGVGKVWIDDVILTQHTESSKRKYDISVDLAAEIPGSLISEKKIPIAVSNSGIQSQDLRVEYSFATPNGPFGKSKTLKLTVNKETSKEILIDVPVGLTGAVKLELNVFENSNIVANGIYRFIIGQPVPQGKNKAFFGVNPVSSLRNPAALEDVKNKYQTAANLGIGTWHHYLNIEHMKVACEEPWVEQMVDAANASGIEWLWTLQNSKLFTGKRAFAPGPGNLGEMINGQVQVNDLDKGRLTEEQFKLWDAWVAALVKKYKGKVKYWEVCNEPNCYVNAEEYMKILKRTSPVIRKNDPEAVIIGGSIVNAFRTPIWNKTISEGHPYFDQFSYHPYRFGLSNPFYGGFPGGLRKAQEDLKKAGSKDKVALTEEFRDFGPPMVDYSSMLEKNEANNLARMYVRALGENCASYHHHHELFRDSTLAPNLGLTAIHTMASILNNANPLGKLEAGPDYVPYIFRIPEDSYPPESLIGTQSASTVIALWTKDVNYAGPVEISLPKTISLVKVFNLYGNRIPVENNHFLINRNLVYIILPGIEPEKAKELLGNILTKLKSIPANN